MNKIFKQLSEETAKAKQALEKDMKETYPNIASLTLYGDVNITFKTDYHSADIYRTQKREDYSVRLECGTKSQTIPTDEEALTHVQALREDRENIDSILDSINEWFMIKAGE